MSFAFKTSKSIIVDNSSFFIGTTGFNTTTTPSNETKITASDAAASDWFGYSVAVGSGRIVVGVYQDDDNGSNSGSAYIFDLDGNELTKITASDGAANDRFGYSVAVGSGRIVVGAHRDDDNGTDSGSAYIFDLDGNELTKITASDGAADDWFGSSVAVGSGRIVVGAYEDDDNGTNSGSVYIFDLDGNQLTKITASDGAVGDNFGYSVAVGSGRIVVGNYSDGTDPGFVYIFDLDGKQLTKIIGGRGERFGTSVAVGSGRIVVGASHNSDYGLYSGSAYIFDLDGNQLTEITASDANGGDNFGISVAVGSGRIVVGAWFDGDNVTYSGSAYIFDLDGNELTKITASDGAAYDYFGYSVAVGSGRIVVGAYGDDDNGSDLGSAYIFETPYQVHYLDQLDKR
jgi:hypothetical protein